LPPVHPHMLRHSRRFSLANRGYDLRLIQDYLGHRDPKHPVQASVAVLHTLVVTGPNVRPDADTIDGCQ
jgi:Phage integrase family